MWFIFGAYLSFAALGFGNLTAHDKVYKKCFTASFVCAVAFILLVFKG